MRHLYSFFLLTQKLHYSWQKFCLSNYCIGKSFLKNPSLHSHQYAAFLEIFLVCFFFPFQVVLTNQMTTRIGQSQSTLVPALGRCLACELKTELIFKNTTSFLLASCAKKMKLFAEFLQCSRIRGENIRRIWNCWRGTLQWGLSIYR